MSTVVDLDELRALMAAIMEMKNNLDVESSKLTKAGEACMSVLSNDKLSVMYALELNLLIEKIKKYSEMLENYAASVGDRIIEIQLNSES